MHLKKTIYKISVSNFENYNAKTKRGVKNILLPVNFLSDAKIRCLTPSTKLLYLCCLLLAGESNQSQIEVNHESLAFQSTLKSKSIQSQLDLLQSFQLLTWQKIEIQNHILKRKKTNIKTNETKDEEISLKKPSSALVKTRGSIELFSSEELLTDLLKNVTHSAQESWLKAYEDVEWVKQEMKKAYAWIMSNPKKAPKDFAKFFNNWLNRAHETHRKSIKTNKPKSEVFIP
jgi:hypothetical protein